MSHILSMLAKVLHCSGSGPSRLLSSRSLANRQNQSSTDGEWSIQLHGRWCERIYSPKGLSLRWRPAIIQVKLDLQTYSRTSFVRVLHCGGTVPVKSLEYSRLRSHSSNQGVVMGTCDTRCW